MEPRNVNSTLAARPKRRAGRICFWLTPAALVALAACSESNPEEMTDAMASGGASIGDASQVDAAAGGGAGATTDHDASIADASIEAGSSGAGGGTGDAQDGGANAGSGGEAGADFVPAHHRPFPLVTAHGGPVLQKVELVPIYFVGDPLIPDLEAFNTWIVSSDYWKTIGADYDVVAGTRLPAVQVTTAPGASITDLQVANWIDAHIADGSLPKPSTNTLFALFYPAATTVTSGSSKSCSGFAGLHQSAMVSNAMFTGKVPFVIIPRCSFSPGDELEIATDVASHEYVEAATDPLSTSDPAWYLDGKTGQPLEAWQMLNGLEVADLCENQSYDVVDGFTVQDSWSNSAAQAGNNPCQPSDPKHPFFMVSAENTIYHAQAGATVMVKGVAWSNMPAPDWELGINWGYTPDSNFDGHATLSRTTVNNGDEVTVAVTIPASPPAAGGRSVYRFTIDSIDPINPNFYHPWPVMIVVP